MSYVYSEPSPHIVCKDGTTLSVQTGENLYCTPRNDNGPYTQVEVGFPSVTPPDSWAEYADGSFPSDVYGYVPIEMVAAYIESHGGIDLTNFLTRNIPRRKIKI